jgi:hypothetical protein
MENNLFKVIIEESPNKHELVHLLELTHND